MSKERKITQVLQCAIAYGKQNAIANTICFSCFLTNRLLIT
ncbi:MAG: hypothetical protein ACYTXT_20775 [Nostoc sp.]